MCTVDVTNKIKLQMEDALNDVVLTLLVAFYGRHERIALHKFLSHFFSFAFSTLFFWIEIILSDPCQKTNGTWLEW